MSKHVKFLVVVTSLTLLLILGVSVALAAPAEKLDVCHLTGTGTFIKINISENAYQTHLDHGDASPGDLVPGVPGKMFADDCTLVDANANVAGTWRGQSGIVGTMGYWFDMVLWQDPDGTVTGNIDYDSLSFDRTVTGLVSGNLFTFTTHDDPLDPHQAYWADCAACTVSVTGTGNYFHGIGTSSSNQSIEWEATKP